MTFKPEKKTLKPKQPSITFHVSPDLLAKINHASDKSLMPRNQFLVQAVEYALDHMEAE